MRVSPRPYRDLLDAARRGDQTTVLSCGRRALDALAADPSGADWTPAALVLLGLALASREQYSDACAYLARGVDTVGDTHGARDIGPMVDVAALTLAGLLARQGRFGEAVPRLRDLAGPHWRIDTRLGAVRGQLALAVLFADVSTAQQLVNTATDLARRSKGRLPAALVDGDRALALATDGRLSEATALAESVVPLLAAPGSSTEQRWANAQAVTVATGLARALAPLGDDPPARRWLQAAGPPAAASRTRWDAAQVALARCVVAREADDPDLSGQAGHEAMQLFTTLNAAPAAALTQLELARLAERQGHRASAAALYRRAEADLAPMGLPRELTAVRAGLDRLDRLDRVDPPDPTVTGGEPEHPPARS